MKRFLLIFVSILASYGMVAQELSGIVTKGGKPRKGLVVSLLNGGQRTTTDKNGRFYFNDAKAGDVLQVNISLRKAARIPVSEARLLKIHIATSDFVLNNGTLEQRLPYTALSNISFFGNVVEHEQIMQSGLLRVSDILRQFMTGVRVTQTFFESDIVVRGYNSVGSGNNPLFFIDGVEYAGTEIDSIVPVETIKRIEVHKDGAQWGARGANGVIEITTIKG